MGNRTATYVMYNSSHDKNNYRFIELCFSVLKRCYYVNYKHDLKAIISYEFPYNDNKMIILMNII